MCKYDVDLFCCIVSAFELVSSDHKSGSGDGFLSNKEFLVINPAVVQDERSFGSFDEDPGLLLLSCLTNFIIVKTIECCSAAFSSIPR